MSALPRACSLGRAPTFPASRRFGCVSRRERLLEPGTREAPVALDGRRRDVENLITSLSPGCVSGRSALARLPGRRGPRFPRGRTRAGDRHSGVASTSRAADVSVGGVWFHRAVAAKGPHHRLDEVKKLVAVGAFMVMKGRGLSLLVPPL